MASDYVLTQTHNCYFKFGYDGTNNYQFRTSPEQKWTVEYGRCSRPPKSFGEECIEAARLISQKTNQDIWICYSGGVDSEFTIWSFLKANVKFKIAIMEFEDEINIYDVSRAKAFCDNLGLKYYIFKLDIIKWWNESLLDYAIPNQCASAAYPVTWWLMEQIDGYPICGLGNQLWEWDDIDKTYYLYEGETLQGTSRYLISNKREATSQFFRYTPEQVLSYLLTPSHMMMFLYGGLLGIKGNRIQRSVKIPAYTDFFPMEPRDKKTGYEKINDLNLYLKNMLREMMPASHSYVKITPVELFDKLRPHEMTAEYLEKNIKWK
jgi:hypothetical protein